MYCIFLGHGHQSCGLSEYLYRQVRCLLSIMGGCTVEEHCNGVVLGPFLGCAEVWESDKEASSLSGLLQSPGGCHEMILHPATKKQIMHKVQQSFSLFFKELYKYFNNTLFNAW